MLSVLPGCVDATGVPTEDDASGDRVADIYKSNVVGWGRDANGITTTVPVCWDERDYHNGPAEPQLSEIKDYVRRAIEETWQRESGLVFVGWGDCHSGSGGTTGIDLHMEASGRGYTYSVHPPWEPHHADVQFNVAGGVGGALRYTVVHEVGHALGLIHEQARPDHGSCNLPDDWDWLVTIPGGTVFTPYDGRSIMNYCAGGPSELSPLDILGIQRIYGRKPPANFVSERGACVTTSGSSVVLGSCGGSSIRSGFAPSGDGIRLDFASSAGPATGYAAAPPNGYGPLAMTTVAINTNWDIYNFSSVSIRGLAGKMLDVGYASTSPGASVGTYENSTITWASSVPANEQWTFHANGSITGLGGQCLDVQWGSSASGTPVWMWPCNGGPAQQWRLSNGDEIVSALGDAVGVRKCLEVNRDEADVVTPLGPTQDVRIADCSGSLRQKWSVRGAVTTADGYGCLSAAGTNGAVVSQSTCTNTPEELFDVHW